MMTAFARQNNGNKIFRFFFNIEPKKFVYIFFIIYNVNIFQKNTTFYYIFLYIYEIFILIYNPYYNVNTFIIIYISKSLSSFDYTRPQITPNDPHHQTPSKAAAAISNEEQ